MGAPHSKWVRVVSIDERLREYQVHLTRNWMAQQTALVEASPVLSAIVNDLGTEVRSVELTASMPFNFVHHMEGFVGAYVRGKGESNSEKIARFIAARLVRRCDIRDAEIRDRLSQESLQLTCDVALIREIVKQPIEEFSADAIWANYLKAVGFRMALSASQSQGIAAAYNGYENFLVRTVAAALGMDNYRKKSDEKFKLKIIEAFGPEVCDHCFADEDVQMFRALRHAISHNGGRVTKELIDLEHPFHEENGVIQFMPQHTMFSLRIVERCVSEVLAAALALPKFQQRRSKLSKNRG